MSNYYITVGANNYSFDAIFNERITGTGVTTTNFFDNNTDVGTKYTNIITNDNPLIKHTSVNYNYNSIDISQYLLPKFIQYTVPGSYTESIPGWCTAINAIIVGGGGGGGGSKFYDDGYYDGGGGGGGGYFNPLISVVSGITSFGINVGGGGSYNNSRDGGNGVSGGNSYVFYNDIYYTAGGGSGGQGASDGSDGNGGNGGTNSITNLNTGVGINGSNGTAAGGSGGKSGFFNITHQNILTNNYGNGGEGDEYVDRGGAPGAVGFVRVYFIR